MHITEVLKRPLLSEKSYQMMQEGVYAFEVSRKANKTQIKKAFETIFEVKVKSVNVMNYDPKQKRMGKFVGVTTHMKKAIITLMPGEKIDLLNEAE